MRPGERQQDQEGADPADAGQRQRRHMAGDMARQHDVARPEQRGQGQQQIGLVVQPPERMRRQAALVRAGSWSRDRDRPDFPLRDKSRACNATMSEDCREGASMAVDLLNVEGPAGARSAGAGGDGEPDAVSRALARRRRFGLGRLSALQRAHRADDQGARRHAAVDRRRQGGRAGRARPAINGTIWRWCIIPPWPPSST